MLVFRYVDYFRLAAAILVVAIHTSPLLSLNETSDFVLTRILARVAVPFFFMATGFLLFGRITTHKDAKENKKRVYRFLHKTSLLYLAAIILYLPLNIYMGYFKENNTFLDFLEDVLFNGTVYHLWYLPAAVCGCFLTWIGMKKLGIKKTFVVTIVLYVIGIFGDSYYKCISSIPIGYEFYKFLFQFFDYTRNGLFFAPIFFMMGTLAGKQKYKLKTKLVWLMFIASMSLMVAEGLILHSYKIQRHDSMYFMLIPSMYFLFQLLISRQGNKENEKIINTKEFRTVSLVIYIIHPWVIVGIRLVAKITRLTDILVTNSMLHFMCVLIISALIGILYTIIKIE
ncbi:MAG: vanTG [Anaerocolumna sp.]|nr:vanTG [Anaerocolumna sp.]